MSLCAVKYCVDILRKMVNDIPVYVLLKRKETAESTWKLWRRFLAMISSNVYGNGSDNIE